MQVKLIALVFVFVFSQVFSMPVFAKEFYKWVDDDGITHYTVAAPKNRPSTLVRTQVSGSAPTPTARGVSASRALPGDEGTGKTAKPKSTVKPASAAALDPNRCSQAKSNIDTLVTHPRIRITDESGNIRYLSDAEKAERQAEAEQAVKESCE